MRAIIALGLSLFAGPALAQRPATFAMSCDHTQAIVVSRGAIVLQTSPTTYDRFVSDRRFCERDEFADPIAVLAADTPSCPLLRCRARSDRSFDR
jgi:hypothetical protein